MPRPNGGPRGQAPEKSKDFTGSMKRLSMESSFMLISNFSNGECNIIFNSTK